MKFSYEVNRKNVDGKEFSIFGLGYESLEIFFYCLQLGIRVKKFVVDYQSDGIKCFFREVITLQEYCVCNTDDDHLIVPKSVYNYLITKNSLKVIELEDIIIPYILGENEVIINDENYRILEKELSNSNMEIVMDTLKWRKKLIVSDGKMISKNSVFDMTKSILEGKKFAAIGSLSELEIMKQFFEFLNITCIYCNDIEDIINLGGAENQYEILYYDNIDNLINERIIKKGYEVKNFLKYSMHETYNRETVMDINLGYSFRYKVSEYAVGFKEYGDYKQAKYKIIAMGNSTTDAGSGSGDESWPCYLYKLLDKIFPNQISILNAGAAGYNISQEFVKFIRDVSVLKPNLVISYSGCLNIAEKHKEKTEFISSWQSMVGKMSTVIENNSIEFSNIDRENKCFGIPYYGSKYSYFIDQAKMLHAAATSIGIDYYCFLQPIIYTKKELCLQEKEKLIYYHSIHINKQVKEFMQEYRLDKNQYDWLIDFTGLFDDFDNVYKDLYHVYGFANKIIGQGILDFLKRNYSLFSKIIEHCTI
ncbi:hypothetical protein SAMN02746066_03336 [Anaerosporobacter mobilis DSM 15930]|uniref:SGNH hydrolase-type esterase domain-containing protein n=1 Tax=Anaerosporobacter mobilis DSM 15930 TaxID=1120996 RepID=A0A1M7LNJ0_9FIRM|nr:SGNH/GDSL hydrolase family protein [Anaerosporobacter mobilis]SHM79815.1 hypothetical protein SAMN02746066_03336 [Anaerosporobacter mobilis DSM 15930]